MERKRVNIFLLDNEFKNIIKAIEAGFIYVGRCFDGACLFINNKGEGKKLKCIMFNTKSCSVTRFELDKITFKKMYNEHLLEITNVQYKIEDNEDDMIEQFYNLGNAIHAMETETGTYKNYKTRKLS
ncbi:MAG TPA: hypothetical protein VIM70_08020 [Clostridium sp.]|uniref:hypothetical protein n=1 Tax=Clostridium sp. TaxID=1506 RepID=UPI002F935E90